MRVAQTGFAAQATYWSAVDLRKAAMSTISEALDTPLRAAHLEGMTALAAEADLLLSGVAVDEYARAMIENEASNLYEASPWAAEKRATEIVRQAPAQAADKGPAEEPGGHGVCLVTIEDFGQSGGGTGCEATQ